MKLKPLEEVLGMTCALQIEMMWLDGLIQIDNGKIVTDNPSAQEYLDYLFEEEKIEKMLTKHLIQFIEDQK